MLSALHIIMCVSAHVDVSVSLSVRTDIIIATLHSILSMRETF